jgi:hypothetical protein
MGESDHEESGRVYCIGWIVSPEMILLLMLLMICSMVVIAVLALTLFHPGYNLPEVTPTSSDGSIEMALNSK